MTNRKVTCEYCSFYGYPSQVDLHKEVEHSVAINFIAERIEGDPLGLRLTPIIDNFGQKIRTSFMSDGQILLRTTHPANIVTINVLGKAKIQEPKKQ